MKYTSPALSFSDQADLLIKRGLNGNKSALVSILKSVSYYRFQEYCYPYKDSSGQFKSDSSLEQIWGTYIFDRQLRLSIMDGIERVETALKTDVAYLHSHKYGPFGFLSQQNLPNLSTQWHQDFLDKIRAETDRSKEPFVIAFFRDHGDQHDYLPVFRVTDIMSFGNIFTFFRGLESKDKKQIASRYNIKAPVLSSWIMTLNYIRNLCAHHGRLYNRILAIKPYIPDSRNNPEWHNPGTISNYRLFSVVSLLQYMIGIIRPESDWKGRFLALLKSYSDISVRTLGFPENWEEYSLWSDRSLKLERTSDFISKYSIACKEARETHYWLRLFSSTELVPEDSLVEVTDECSQIIAILTTIIKKLKYKKGRK